MKTITIINMKGGCAKTTTAVNMGYILAIDYNKRVLLIDNDKQGNLSKAYNAHSYESYSLADILTGGKNILEVIQKTEYQNINVIPANMHLLSADLSIMKNEEIEQDTILRYQFEKIKRMYDYCIIDCPPDFNIPVINALVAANEVIIPIKIDGYSLEGMTELEEQIKNAKRLNSKLKFRGCLVTMFYKTTQKKDGIIEAGVNEQALSWLKTQRYPIFNTCIRRTNKKVEESTFTGMPLVAYSPRCGAAIDYKEFTREYLEE